MRQSHHFGLTWKDDPKEAQTPGHRLLLRAGYIRQVTPGVHAGMPFLLRVLDKIGGLVRAELRAKDYEELLLPILQPQNLWGESVSSSDPPGGGMFTFKDRRGSVLGIGSGSETLIASLAKREIRSYKNLPQKIFQIHQQFQDEPRTRQGLVNDREFLLHEAYSLDADADGLQASYRAMSEAFHAVLMRLRLDYRCVEADLAPNEGGGRRHVFVALTENGADAIVACDACGYAATRQTGQSRLEVLAQDAEMKPMEAVYGPGLIGVGPLAEFIGIPVWKTTKTLLFQADDQVVAVMVRGDCDVNEDKVKRFLKCRELTLATPRVITELTGAEVGYAGGVGLPAGVSVLADHFTRDRINFECGANRTDYHNINVNWGRDLPQPTFGDFKTAREGEQCARCDPGRIREMRGIEVGGLAARGTAPAEASGLAFQDPSGKPRPVHMGSYRLNLSRLAAALVEQHHDEAGIQWPASVAPFQVHLIGLNLEDEGVRTEAEKIYRRLRDEQVEVLYDDGAGRAGEKFSDSDLFGIPVRLTISKRTFKEGRLELKLRGASQYERVTVEEALKTIRGLCD